MVTKKWLGLAAPLVVLAFGASACGSSDGPQLDAWAKSVCGGMQTPIQQANTALADTGAVKTGETPKDLQTRLAADFGILATANTQLAQAVQQAGAPKVDSGAQTQADAVSELNQASGGYTKVQQAVQALDVTDQAKFAASLKGVSDQVQQQSELSTAALQKLQTGDLGTALAKQPACKSVNAGPAGGSTTAPGASDPAATGSPAATTSTSASTSATAKPSGSAPAKPSATPSPSGSAH
ncbi:small secreted protein [Streptacidiphilus sp. EB129]|uniref:small secreted protein n=1 Tax=Streptacidiphilus sp. EB129 TaxID=3156262 RepID=UPI0035138644